MSFVRSICSIPDSQTFQMWLKAVDDLLAITTIDCLAERNDYWFAEGMVYSIDCQSQVQVFESVAPQWQVRPLVA